MRKQISPKDIVKFNGQYHEGIHEVLISLTYVKRNMFSKNRIIHLTLVEESGKSMIFPSYKFMEVIGDIEKGKIIVNENGTLDVNQEVTKDIEVEFLNKEK